MCCGKLHMKQNMAGKYTGFNWLEEDRNPEADGAEGTLRRRAPYHVHLRG